MSNSDIDDLEKLNISYKDDELDEQVFETNEVISQDTESKNEENKYNSMLISYFRGILYR